MKSIFFVFAALSVMPFVNAADPYPSRPIKLVVQFPPGGTTDIVARLIADGMTRELGQPLVVENRAGASGIIGSDVVAKSAGDGYTLGMATVTTHAINPFVRKMPFDVVKDLTAVINVAAVPNVMTVNPKLPASNVKELIATLKANPEKYAFATSGPGAEGHVAMESFKKITETQALHVPYKGSGPALQDTIAGTTQIMAGNLPSLMPFIQSGSLKALAITGSQRLATLPSVPTYIEVGLPELNRASWFGLIVSSKTPAAIVNQLNVAANKVLADPATRAALEKIGARAEGGSAASFAAIIKEEMLVQHDIVKFAKITAD